MKSGGYYAHPRYNGNLIINDYAVIEMATPFTFNEYTQPIKVVDATTERPPDRAPLMTSGYGYYQYDSSGLRPDRRVSRLG